MNIPVRATLYLTPKALMEEPIIITMLDSFEAQMLTSVSVKVLSKMYNIVLKLKHYDKKVSRKWSDKEASECVKLEKGKPLYSWWERVKASNMTWKDKYQIFKYLLRSLIPMLVVKDPSVKMIRKYMYN